MTLEMEIVLPHILPSVNLVQKQLNTFDLPSHVQDNLTASQSAELIADHFGAISMDYDPININNFPPSMREAMSQPDVSVIPQLEEYEVYKKICKSKKPNSTVPGDIPKKIVKEFSCELSLPVTIIYRGTY